MGPKNKRTRTFEKKALGGVIKKRKQHQQKQRQIENRRTLRAKGSAPAGQRGVNGDSDEEDGLRNVKVKGKSKATAGDEDSGDEELDEETLAALLGDDDDDEGASQSGEDDEDEGLDNLEGEEEKHKLDIAALKEKDPEFYKFLLENDKTLLDFGEGGDAEESDDDDDEDMEADGTSEKKAKKAKKQAKKTTVTKELLSEWQKQMLQQRSLKALRRVLLCFRAAADSSSLNSRNEDEKSDKKGLRKTEEFVIPNAVLFNKVVVIALKYTPLVLSHHVPYKETGNGKYKLPTQSKKYATAQRIIKSYFSSLHLLLSTLSVTTSTDLLHLSLVESSKLIPYLLGNRKATKDYLRLCLEYWSSSSADDSVRLASYLSLRKLGKGATEAGTIELVLKGAYLAIQQAAKTTTSYTLPSINLMKNSASELFVSIVDQETSYQIAFGYIRALAVTLRNSMKSKSTQGSGGGAAGQAAKKGGKEAHSTVYNWQVVHSIDFWSLVLATACDRQRVMEEGRDSPLQPLIYPLVQISLGIIRLVPTSRYYPLRFQLISSLLRIMQRTGTYIPLAPFLLEIFDSSEFSRKPKGASLKPLDWNYYIRAPAAYPKTRVYVDGLIDEVTYLLVEFFASSSTSISFPELILPICIALRRHVKKSKNNKMTSALKSVIERLEANAKFVEEKREKIEFSPQDREQVDAFLAGEEGSPLRTYLKLVRKQRDAKRELLEKSLQDDEDGDGQQADDAEDGEEMEEDDEE